jgi:hypothetical protein
MTTLPPPATRPSPDNSLEKKVYQVVDQFIENLPVANDRNRLGFCLYKYVMGEGDEPQILMKSTKVKIVGIAPDELAKKISVEIDKIKSGLK